MLLELLLQTRDVELIEIENQLLEEFVALVGVAWSSTWLKLQFITPHLNQPLMLSTLLHAG